VCVLGLIVLLGLMILGQFSWLFRPGRRFFAVRIAEVSHPPSAPSRIIPMLCGDAQLRVASLKNQAQDHQLLIQSCQTRLPLPIHRCR
jgi:hypothetical protein